MKINIKTIMAVALICALLYPMTASATTKQYAKETETYKESLTVWANGVKVARDRALSTYQGVQFVVDSMKWEPSRTYRNLNDLIIELRVFNTGGVYVEVAGAFLEFRDGSKRKVNIEHMRDRIELAPGDIRSLIWHVYGRSFAEYYGSVTNGKVAVQIYPMYLDVKELPDYQGKLKATGAPFLPNKPRDPFWLDEKEINFLAGKAEMAAGVYDQNVKFPAYGWWPVPGENGGYSGQLPGPMATVKTPQPMPAYVNSSGQQGQPGEEDGMTMEETTDAVKSTTEAAKSIGSLINTIGSLF